MSEQKTVKMKLSSKAKEALFSMCRYKEGGYPSEKILDAANLLKKLRKDAKKEVIKAKDQFGRMKEATIYENFTELELDLTIDEINIARERFKCVKGWNPETEPEIYLELREQLK
jgi:hypothetical protein